MSDVEIGADEAADIIGVSRNTVVAMILDGRLQGDDRGPGTRPRYRVLRSSALALEGAGHDRQALNQPVGRVATSRRGGTPDADSASEEPAKWAEREDPARALQRLREEVAHLRAENARLRLAARNANVALQAQTESLQQFLIDDTPSELS